MNMDGEERMQDVHRGRILPDDEREEFLHQLPSEAEAFQKHGIDYDRKSFEAGYRAALHYSANRIHRLEGEIRLRKNFMDRLPFCPDHRDKVRGLSCRQCQIEVLEAEKKQLRMGVRAAADALVAALSAIADVAERASQLTQE